MPEPIPIQERFWKLAETNDNCCDCWEWKGFINWAGYGLIRKGGTGSDKNKLLRAHRISWEMAYGQIPHGMEVCHKCDNPKCIRPTHLFLGTRKDNVRDMVEKQRSASGAKNGMVKLTEDQVRQIRQKHVTYTQGGQKGHSGIKDGLRPNSEASLALEFGVTRSQIHRIIRGHRWSHIT